jgi:hypothetical protein
MDAVALTALYSATSERHPHGVTFVGELSDVPASLVRIERLKPYPSRETLLRLFDYNPETGEICWAVKPARSKITIGSVAGTISSNGYRQIGAAGALYFAHVLAYIMTHGYRPLEIDHRDGGRDNNRMVNLRLCSHAQNESNKPKLRSNTSGYIGVTYDKSKRKWLAQIGKSGKNHNLGYYDTSELAHARYLEAARAHRGEFLHASLREAAA